MEDIFEAPNVVVVKVGSSTLVDESGRPDRTFIGSLCDQAADLQEQDDEIHSGLFVNELFDTGE